MAKGFKVQALGGTVPVVEGDAGYVAPGSQKVDAVAFEVLVTKTTPVTIEFAMLDVPGSDAEGYFALRLQQVADTGEALGAQQVLTFAGGVVDFPDVPYGHRIECRLDVDVPGSAPLDMVGQLGLLEIRGY